MNITSNDDTDIRAMKSANRKGLLIGLLVVLGIAALGGVYVLAGRASVKATLEADGYTNVDVKMNSPLEYGFTAQKGASTCGGTVTRVPGSTSRQETCFSGK
jgi:hypothetical protein